jgi:hypothetical protein
MADLEHARSILRMAHKDFNALVGMRENPLFADEQSVFTSSKQWKRR